MTPFQQFSLRPSVLKGLASLGFTTPTPIQEAAIPLVLDGRDAILQAKTGSGKTLAFGLPILSLLEPQAIPQALVVLPTRELALQVAEAIQSVGQTDLRVLSIFGGVKIEPQERALRDGVDLVIGTPGRLKDLIQRGTLDLSNIRILVLDEADEMLDMGFRRDIDFLLERMPAREQTLILSATMPPEIEVIARKHLKDPAVVKLTQETIVPEEIDHFFVRVKPEQRLDALVSLLQSEAPSCALIFTKMKHETRALARKLERFGIEAGFLNGNMSQNARNRMMERFRAGEFRFLVATDVAARGLDIEGLSHVFHYAIPTVVETYIHRSGRTGRAGNKGRAIALVTPESDPDFRAIQRKISCAELKLSVNSVMPEKTEKTEKSARVEKTEKTEKVESWKRYKLMLTPEHKQTSDTFQAWLSKKTGVSKEMIRMVAFLPDHALV
ncbi:MAG: DEAD/DEAH box helicase, partial [Bacteroidota bacterium]